MDSQKLPLRSGVGVVILNDKNEVLTSLLESKSGLALNPEYKENGMRCHISGQVNPNLDVIDRKMLRFMSETSAYAFLSTEEALADAGLSFEDINNDKTGVIVGSGTGSSRELKNVVDTAREKGIKRIGPYAVTLWAIQLLLLFPLFSKLKAFHSLSHLLVQQVFTVSLMLLI